MSDPDKFVINDIEIEKSKINELIHWIILQEKNNIKTNEKSYQEMVEAIQQKIEEVVQ
jgi:lysophospholipase L1-like esterase